MQSDIDSNSNNRKRRKSYGNELCYDLNFMFLLLLFFTLIHLGADSYQILYYAAGL
jgi:hypothetical protein